MSLGPDKDWSVRAQLATVLRERNRDGIRESLAQLFSRHGARRPLGALPPRSDPDSSNDEGLSRFQRYRRCRAASGLSPHELRRMHRVELARTMIATGIPLAEAALAAGFADQAHMTRQLRQLWGVTPAALRRSAANKE